MPLSRVSIIQILKEKIEKKVEHTELQKKKKKSGNVTNCTLLY